MASKMLILCAAAGLQQLEWEAAVLGVTEEMESL
jgi:hypothetical protein